MQRHADVPFKVSGLDPAIFEAWTRTGLCNGDRTIDVMHPDRLVNLRSLVRRSPLISMDDLIEEGNILDRKERMTASKIISSRGARRGANQTTEMAREVQETIKVLKKHVKGMDGEELEDRYGGNKANHTSTEEVAARVRLSPLSGVRVGPSLSTKLNFILSEVCLYTCANDRVIAFRAPAGPAILREREIPDILQLYPHALPNRRGFVTIRNQVSTVHCWRGMPSQGTMHHDVRDVGCVQSSFGGPEAWRAWFVSSCDRRVTSGTKTLCRNLISASRIIFCEPVWHPDVESQAIKVETLPAYSDCGLIRLPSVSIV